MSGQDQADLATMVGYLPELKVLRDFVDRLESLFEEGQGEALAWGRHAALGRSSAFLAVPELAKAIGMLPAEKFAKVIAFLRSRACDRVRTNNHVERVNRKLSSWRSGWIGGGDRNERPATVGVMSRNGPSPVDHPRRPPPRRRIA
jgi:hypothetical protein